MTFENEEYTEEEKKALQALRKLIAESVDDIVIRNSWEATDDILLRFILGRNFDITTAGQRLLKLANARRNHPEIFSTLYPSALTHAFRCKGYSILRNRDTKGRHIYCIRTSGFDPDITNVEDLLRADLIFVWEMIRYKETILNGIVVIVDCGAFTLKQAASFSPLIIKKYGDLILKTTPVKIKSAHVIFAPKIFNKTLSLVKFFLPKKLRERIYVHGSLESFHEWISPDILPQWAGGRLTDDEAYEKTILDGLFTPERDEWYKTHCTEIK